MQPKLIAAVWVSMAVLAAPAAAQELNVYTTREPGLIQPLLEAFTRDTGVEVNSIFVRDGLAERVLAEGERSPADILMTVDFGELVFVEGFPIRKRNVKQSGKHSLTSSTRSRIRFLM